MALQKRLVGICASMLVFAHGALAQFQPTTANQDGILVFDSLGQFFSAPLDDNLMGPFLFKEMEATAGGFNFGLPLFKDFEFVAAPDGSPLGGYALDVLGGQYQLTLQNANPAYLDEDGFLLTPLELGMKNPNFSGLPYFQVDAARDIEIAPDWRLRRFGYEGYFLLDADGVVHSVGNTNLPSYAYGPPGSEDPEDAEIIQTPFPNNLDVTGTDFSPLNVLLKEGVIDFPVNRQFSPDPINSVTPTFTYFGPGSNIAKDLEVSAEFAQLTVPMSNGDIETINIARTNGYYIMDGFGAVHSNLMALDFDTDGNQGIYYNDMVDGVAFDEIASATPYDLLTEDDLDPNFGIPINKAPLAAPWSELQDQLPYFLDANGGGIDVAVDIEITPSGKGFYLLDAFGGVHTVGDANFSFPPQDVDGQVQPSQSRTPYYGFTAATDLMLITNEANDDLGVPANRAVVGYIVLDGFGTTNVAGIARDFDIDDRGNQGAPLFSQFLSFRSANAAPVWQVAEPRVTAPGDNFVALSGPFTSSVRFDFQTATGVQTSRFSLAPGFRNVTAAFSQPAPFSVSRPQENVSPPDQN